MVKLIVMCGLQGSGKSTIARKLSEEIGNCEIVSSDEIRKEHKNQIENDKVFKIYYERAKKFLKEGKNVILDATNISIKSRKQIFEQVKDIECEKTCYIVNTPVNVCAERVLERNKTNQQAEVPLEVLFKYQKSFEIPFYEEGWNDIVIDTHDKFSDAQYELLIETMNNFDQKNSHHKYNLGKHCKELQKQLDNFKFPKRTGMLHDVGKLFTQTIDEKGQAHYYQHHNVGAYFLLSHSYLIDYDNSIDFFDLLFYVNYHMIPFNIQTEKAEKKWSGIFGKHKFEMLKILNKGDKIASGTHRENND